MGHGGMGIASLYPMNSLESLKKCFATGADGTELDVQMTKDSVLVAFHDEYLDKSTNGEGQIFTKTWDELKALSYSSPPFMNYALINLDELFLSLDNPSQYTFFLDCKLFNPDNSTAYLQRFSNALSKLMDTHQLKQVYIELRRPDMMAYLKNQRPDWSIFSVNDFEAAYALVKKYKLNGISIAIDKITKAQIEQAHAEGILISVYRTRSRSSTIEAIEKNVDFIQSDKLKYLLRVLD